MTLRLAHLSDIHIAAREPRWAMRDWFSKRLTGWFNLRSIGRGHRFRQAEEVLTALAGELRSERKPDHMIFSGDATALGFAEEMERAAAILGVGDGTIPGLAVPGNHDYYTAGVAASGLFERLLRPLATGRTPGRIQIPICSASRRCMVNRRQFLRRQLLALGRRRPGRHRPARPFATTLATTGTRPAHPCHSLPGLSVQRRTGECGTPATRCQGVVGRGRAGRRRPVAARPSAPALSSERSSPGAISRSSASAVPPRTASGVTTNTPWMQFACTSAAELTMRRGRR